MEFEIVPNIDPELIEHLRSEFGEHGKRSCRFLCQAHHLLTSEAQSLPCLGETVAYSIREALTSILDVADDDMNVNGKTLSQYNVGRHQRRLNLIIKKRTGGTLLSSEVAKDRSYASLISDANNALHGQCSHDDASDLWEQCTGVLSRLFMPPDLKVPELERLATVKAPSRANLDTVLGSVASTSVDVARFLRHVVSPSWLRLLSEADGLGKPGSAAWRAACHTAVRLASADRSTVMAWLNSIHDESDARSANMPLIADACAKLGGSGLALLLEILCQSPDNRQIAMAASRAVLQHSASDPMVDKIADLLLNAPDWDTFHSKEVSTHLTETVMQDNALDRISLFAQKLNKVDDRDVGVYHLEIDDCGTVTDTPHHFASCRSSVLRKCLVRTIQNARDYCSAAAILESLAPLRGKLGERFNAWVLASASHDRELSIRMVEQAIANPEIWATGDHVLLVKRVIHDDSAESDYVDRWRKALGSPPSISDASRLMKNGGSERLELARRTQWANILPAAVSATWDDVSKVVATRYCPYTADSLIQFKSEIKTFTLEPPFRADVLASEPPHEAAARISRWRPDPNDYTSSLTTIRPLLADLVERDTTTWLADPLDIVTTLYHPAYIRDYLNAIAGVGELSQLDFDGFMQVLELVKEEPWPVEDLGDRFDRTPGWKSVHGAAVDVVMSLIRSEISVLQYADGLLDYLWIQVQDVSGFDFGYGFSSDHKRFRFRAVNRISTRAFDAIVGVVSCELNASTSHRPDFEVLLDWTLQLDSDDGGDYRAVIARHILWLRHWMPDWFESNIDRLFGESAPEGLGQTTFDMAVMSGSTDDWLRVTFPDLLRDAASRGVENALAQVLVGMLRGQDGYSVPDVAGYLQAHSAPTEEGAADDVPGMVERSGPLLKGMLSEGDITDHQVNLGVELWRALLDSPAKTRLTGFGWMHGAEKLDDDIWAELTLSTLEAIDGEIEWWGMFVAERAMQQPVTIVKVRLLLRLVQADDMWTLHHVSELFNEFDQDVSDAVRESDDYRRLLTAVRERDLFD